MFTLHFDHAVLDAAARAKLFAQAFAKVRNLVCGNTAYRRNTFTLAPFGLALDPHNAITRRG